MPPICAEHSGFEARIKELERRESDRDTDIVMLFKAAEELRMSISNRWPPSAVVVATTLSAIAGTEAGLLIQHLLGH